MAALRLVLYMCLLLKGIDIYTTLLIVSDFGIMAEMNPVLRFFMRNFGMKFTMILNGLLFSGTVIALYLKKRIALLYVVLVIMLAIVLSNIRYVL